MLLNELTPKSCWVNTGGIRWKNETKTNNTNENGAESKDRSPSPGNPVSEYKGLFVVDAQVFLLYNVNGVVVNFMVQLWPWLSV